MRKLSHLPPYGIYDGVVFSSPYVAAPRELNQLCHSEVGEKILGSISRYHAEHRWYCSLALLMPDHVHLLISLAKVDLSKVVGSWKKWIAMEHSIRWQKNFFDHRLRNEETVVQKGDYILNNPVRAGLIDKPENWPYFWRPVL